jgi:hypothetical protein
MAFVDRVPARGRTRLQARLGLVPIRFELRDRRWKQQHYARFTAGIRLSATANSMALP